MKKLFLSFRYAFDGISHVFRHEQNFRVELFCALTACAFGVAFSITNSEWLVLLINIGVVLSAELFNTAAERLCNLVVSEINPQIKIIKDVSAAAVLITATVAGVCAAVIFIPHFVYFIKSFL